MMRTGSCLQICKDKVEAEVWFSGLKALISSGQYGRPKIDGWSNGLYYNVNLLYCYTLLPIILFFNVVFCGNKSLLSN